MHHLLPPPGSQFQQSLVSWDLEIESLDAIAEIQQAVP
jgi:hypothetical protein